MGLRVEAHDLFWRPSFEATSGLEHGPVDTASIDPDVVVVVVSFNVLLLDVVLSLLARHPDWTVNREAPAEGPETNDVLSLEPPPDASQIATAVADKVGSVDASEDVLEDTSDLIAQERGRGGVGRCLSNVCRLRHLFRVFEHVLRLGRRVKRVVDDRMEGRAVRESMSTSDASWDRSNAQAQGMRNVCAGSPSSEGQHDADEVELSGRIDADAHDRVAADGVEKVLDGLGGKGGRVEFVGSVDRRLRDEGGGVLGVDVECGVPEQRSVWAAEVKDISGALLLKTSSYSCRRCR